MKKGNFPHSRELLTGGMWGAGISEGNIAREKNENKTQNTPTDTYVCHQLVGAGQEACAASFVLRIRIWPEYLEDNLRELTEIKT